ncbi:lipoprotein [Erwinia sp. E_sp_W01_6]|uniref:LPS translocon maturation chaperone LptM n=1 Tax=unclassified Erwinia TaxID=2622719 RepID=UPI0030D1891E
MNKMICRMALVLAVTSLAGCGLKGPLYFPPQEKPKQQTTESTDPAAGTSTDQTGETSATTEQTSGTTTDQSSGVAQDGTQGRLLTTEPETQSAQ